MASPAKQKATIAQVFSPLPDKSELSKTFRQYYQEISQLKPVLFNYFPADQNNPYSLPDSIGRILFHEQLVNIYGQPVLPKLSLLDDPVYKHKLESKIFLALTHHAIGVNYFKYLAPQREDKLLKNLDVARQWQTVSQLICEDLARESAIVFSVDFYPQHSVNHQFFPDIKPANISAKKAVHAFLAKNANIYSELIALSLQPTKISKQQINYLAENTLQILTNEIPGIDPILQGFLISVDRQPKFTINLHYPD